MVPGPIAAAAANEQTALVKSTMRHATYRLQHGVVDAIQVAADRDSLVLELQGWLCG